MKPLRDMMLAVSMTIFSFSAQAEIVVIVHPGNAENQISIEAVRDIYLGRVTTLPGGAKAVAVDQKDGTPAKTEFQEKVIKMNAGQVKGHWSKLIFSGAGVPPSVIGGSNEVRNWVASNPNGIGYIDKKAADGSVKVLLTIP